MSRTRVGSTENMAFSRLCRKNNPSFCRSAPEGQRRRSMSTYCGSIKVSKAGANFCGSDTSCFCLLNDEPDCSVEMSLAIRFS